MNDEDLGPTLGRRLEPGEAKPKFDPLPLVKLQPLPERPFRPAAERSEWERREIENLRRTNRLPVWNFEKEKQR